MLCTLQKQKACQISKLLVSEDRWNEPVSNWVGNNSLAVVTVQIIKEGKETTASNSDDWNFAAISSHFEISHNQFSFQMADMYGPGEWLTKYFVLSPLLNMAIFYILLSVTIWSSGTLNVLGCLRLAWVMLCCWILPHINPPALCNVIIIFWLYLSL